MVKATARSQVGAYFIAATVAILVIGMAVVIHEVYPPFKDLLVRMTGHHWLTKSVLAIPVFVLASVLLLHLVRNPRTRRALRADRIWLWSVVTSAVTVLMIAATFVTYTVEYLMR